MKTDRIGRCAGLFYAVAGIVSFTLSTSLPVQANEIDAKSILRRIEARRSEVYSGRFKIRKSYGTAARKQTSVFTCSVSGDTWICRGLDVPWVEVNRNGNSFVYYEADQSDGTVDKLLGVEDTKAILDASPYNKFLYSGSFWEMQTLEYMMDHAERVHIENVDDSHVILKLEVPKADAYEAFVSLPSTLNDGGRIHVEVDLSRGAITSKITFSSNQGMGRELVFSDFREVAPGLHYPMTSNLVNFNSKGEPRFSAQLEVLEIGEINELIPEQDFEFTVPVDTIVSDKRTGSKGASFRLNGSDGELEDVLSKLGPQRAEPIARHSYIYFSLLGVVLCVAGFFLGRHFRFF